MAGDRRFSYEDQAENYTFFADALRAATLATHPSPPLPGQPGVAEMVDAEAGATDRNIRDLAEAVADASYKVGWEGLTRQQQATECMRAEVVLRTDWFTNHVAAEVARALDGDA
ncbi:hypothetical protein EFK50_07710 [Nocardioides marmoriginsengisoli]|uniref:Uncharacterized protein n=2 Tax=Nocardioides marmoriginsengisoli TaxID=661483 RepID=A0A3N0CM66_9ACTN|nr:hypothetical protein EFK50_07710 [Nocardioides marmoriginsengisoli]